MCVCVCDFSELSESENTAMRESDEFYLVQEFLEYLAKRFQNCYNCRANIPLETDLAPF